TPSRPIVPGTGALVLSPYTALCRPAAGPAGAGVGRSAIARPHGGTMDALDLLTADHNRVRGLFDRFRDADEHGDTAALGELGPKDRKSTRLKSSHVKISTAVSRLTQ